ncbi:MAG TPA: hypothetical protein VM580_07510, partial [Labilithrix sp.]|nr:hypothetical protein [Labilithrix sp.]
KVRREDDSTTAPRGTTACSSNPGSEDCTSCGFQTLCDPKEAFCQKLKSDPNCTSSGVVNADGDGYNGYYGPKDDELNVRFHRMKERYGIDPQYPIRRYIDGFTKFKVPDRSTEHVTKTAANGRRDIAGYTSTGKCTNPLFAAKLPRNPGDELCDIPRSTRSPDLVFFAVVGGVPNKLLHFDPNDPEASRINSEDWVKILGRDPGNYNYEGIDPHMIQSVEPRTGVGLTVGNDVRGDNGSDPVHGREWNTAKGDLQYACTFRLPLKMERVCAQADNSCDCIPNSGLAPPLCDSADPNRQVRAKAYPTIREFQVVRALGDQGIISSLCPITLEKVARDNKNDKTYGYRPAVAVIVDRLKNALTTQCLPQKLRDEGAEVSEVPCLVLAQLADTSDTCDRYGLNPPAKAILDVFLEQQRAETGNVTEGGLDLAALPVCEIPQQTVAPGETCKDAAEKRWCYVENSGTQSPAGRCPQALIFSGGTAELAGARFSLQCIRQFASGEVAGDTKQ